MDKHNTIPVIKMELHRYDIDRATGKLLKRQKINLPKEPNNDTQRDT